MAGFIGSREFIVHAALAAAILVIGTFVAVVAYNTG